MTIYRDALFLLFSFCFFSFLFTSLFVVTDGLCSVTVPFSGCFYLYVMLYDATNPIKEALFQVYGYACMLFCHFCGACLRHGAI